MRKTLLMLLLSMVLFLSGCTTEQTIVKKVNEPMALKPVEQVKPVASAWGDAVLLSIAPDHQTALLCDQDQLKVMKQGAVTDLLVLLEPADLTQAAARIIWSPNSRYVC